MKLPDKTTFLRNKSNYLQLLEKNELSLFVIACSELVYPVIKSWNFNKSLFTKIIKIIRDKKSSKINRTRLNQLYSNFRGGNNRQESESENEDISSALTTLERALTFFIETKRSNEFAVLSASYAEDIDSTEVHKIFLELYQFQESDKFNPITKNHLSSTVISLAKQKDIYPILADALQDMDYNNETILNALRTNNIHTTWIKEKCSQ